MYITLTSNIYTVRGIIILERSDTLPFVVVVVGPLLTVGVVVVFRLGSLLTQVAG